MPLCCQGRFFLDSGRLSADTIIVKKITNRQMGENGMEKATVLIVDDDIDFVRANRTALEASGYRVLAAHNAHDALRLAQENHVDVAILDVMMDNPEEGFMLAREMRKDARTKGIPLVMLSSVNEVNRQAGYPFQFSDSDRDETWLPIDRFLDKPVRPHQLAEAIRPFVHQSIV